MVKVYGHYPNMPRTITPVKDSGCATSRVPTGRVVKVYGDAQAPVSQKFGIQTTARVHVDVCDVIDTPSFVLR